MMEFGSDFHDIDYPEGKSLLEYLLKNNLYASGRQALLDLATARCWKRLWVPSYFCEESLDCIAKAGIELKKYRVTPLAEPEKIVKETVPSNGDGLLVVNYFGLFDVRCFGNIGCEVVEDHTHNLIGNWALNSTADWCIASLRKTLPIADGGILWSPKHHILPASPLKNVKSGNIMARRSKAMTLKSSYLRGDNVSKSEFLELFRETESAFSEIPVSSISEKSHNVVEHLDIKTWYEAKRQNWIYLSRELKNCLGVRLLVPENPEDVPFSVTLLFDDSRRRDFFRKKLIEKSVYPAILWNIDSDEDSVKSFGDRMLSLHCDGRYSLADMAILRDIITTSFY